MPRLEFRSYATTHGLGPFHPAIRTDATVYYWPNITMAREDEAYAWACEALHHAYAAANAVAAEWNVYPTR